MLTCLEIAELASAHLHGRVSLTESLKFHVHRTICHDDVRQLALTQDSLAAPRDLPLDEGSVGAVRAVFAAARGAP